MTAISCCYILSQRKNNMNAKGQSNIKMEAQQYLTYSMLTKCRRLAVESAHSSFPTLHARVWIAEFSVCDMYKWLFALGQDCTPTDDSNQESSS